MTVMAGRRRQEIARGDAIVVPRGLALDIEPEVDLLGVRYDGPPPDHFRERFIQVWGFEHLAAQASQRTLPPRRPRRHSRRRYPSSHLLRCL